MTDRLTDYERGFLEGMERFAWWRDGEMFVGSVSTTLAKAKRDFLSFREVDPGLIAEIVPETPAERYRRESPKRCEDCGHTVSNHSNEGCDVQDCGCPAENGGR